MPAHRSRAIASAHATGAPTCCNPHHRVRDAELTHTPEHEHITSHRCRAFPLHAQWLHSHHPHLITTTPPPPLAGAAPCERSHLFSSWHHSPHAMPSPHPPSTSTASKPTCTTMQHSSTSPLHPLHHTPTAPRHDRSPPFIHARWHLRHRPFHAASTPHLLPPPLSIPQWHHPTPPSSILSLQLESRARPALA